MLKEIINFVIYIFLIFSLTLSNNNIDDISIISNTSDDVYFKLNIPDINLNKDVHTFNSKNNSVDKGIYLVKDYDINKLKGSLILASHSGSSEISYFKNLDKIDVGTILYLTYNDNNYFYKITSIYKIDKTGKFKYMNKDKAIYLITCDKNNKHKQIVFYGELIKKIKKSSFF